MPRGKRSDGPGVASLEGELSIVARPQGGNRFCDLDGVRLDLGPTRGRQHKDRQAPPSQVLLVAKAVVSRDQHIESGFRCGEKLPVLKGCPASFVRGRDRVASRKSRRGAGTP